MTRSSTVSKILLAVGVAISFNVLNAMLPVEILNLRKFGQLDSKPILAQLGNCLGIETSKQAVVRIYAIDKQSGKLRVGSGFIFHQSGFILTSSHLFLTKESPYSMRTQIDGTNVIARMSNGYEFGAKPVAMIEDGLGIAILKISAPNNFPSLAFANAEM